MPVSALTLMMIFAVRVIIVNSFWVTLITVLLRSAQIYLTDSDDRDLVHFVVDGKLQISTYPKTFKKHIPFK